jgi:chromate transporter
MALVYIIFFMDEHGARSRPHSLTELFIAFTLLALQGFGGVLAIVQRELVEKRGWLTQEEFIEEWAVAQIMPGPNVVNLSLMIGSRYFGWRGALAALGGMLTLPLIVILLLALVHGRFASHPGVAGALRGMAAVSAGLIGATGLKMLSALKNNPVPLPWSIALAILSFTLVALLRVPLPYVLLSCGPLACLLAYQRLR